MRVLVLGATGFIGSAVAARLRAAGHRVLAAARPGSSMAALQGQDWLRIDIARADRPEDWRPHLDGVDAVLNCAGVFQDSPRDSTAGVHAACTRRGRRRSTKHARRPGCGGWCRSRDWARTRR